MTLLLDLLTAPVPVLIGACGVAMLAVIGAWALITEGVRAIRVRQVRAVMRELGDEVRRELRRVK